MLPGEITKPMLPEDETARFSVADIEFARKKETITQNTVAQKQAELVAEKLASMRADRAASIAESDRDENGRVRNGLFGWRILKRSILTSRENRHQARSDRQEAEEYAKQESGMYEQSVETTLERAAKDWEGVSNATCKKELSELMELVNQRYKLDQEEPASMGLGGKLRQALLSNSRLLNMGIGAGFRIAFKTATHLTGLGGAVLASGIYGGVSTGLREYARIKKEKLGMKGWREELDRIDSTNEKLALMRQIAKKENFRKYFAGNSSEAFEFLNIFYHLSAQADQENLSDIASPNLLKEIYRRKGIGQEALIQAGKGAFRAMAYSAIGYEIANAFSGLIHANEAVENEPPGTRVSDAPQGAMPSHDLAPGTHEGTLDPNAPPGAHESPAPQGATRLPPETGGHPVDTPPVEQNAPDTPEASHSSVEWRPQGRLTITNHQFETGQGHDSVVKIEENPAVGDEPGASPEEVAHEIARNIGRGPSGQSLEISAAQQQQIEDHISTWLHNNQSDSLHEGLYPTGEEVHVPSDELNAALKAAKVDTAHIEGLATAPQPPPDPTAQGATTIRVPTEPVEGYSGPTGESANIPPLEKKEWGPIGPYPNVPEWPLATGLAAIWIAWGIRNFRAKQKKEKEANESEKPPETDGAPDQENPPPTPDQEQEKEILEKCHLNADKPRSDQIKKEILDAGLGPKIKIEINREEFWVSSKRFKVGEISIGLIYKKISTDSYELSTFAQEGDSSYLSALHSQTAPDGSATLEIQQSGAAWSYSELHDIIKAAQYTTIQASEDLIKKIFNAAGSYFQVK